MVFARWRIPATAPGAAPGRLGRVDAARGWALAAMVAFHARWDAVRLGLAGDSGAVGPHWQVVGDGVAGAFLLLSGVSLVLAARRGVTPRGAAQRLVRLAAVALGITAATAVAVPGLTVTGGIIHCIVLANALTLPLLGAPRWISVAAAGALFALPLLPLPAGWEGPFAGWLGLGTSVVDTLDYRPLAPWGGFVPLGATLARSLPEHWFAGRAGWRTPRWMGRHSLFVYLTHQVVLYPALALLAFVLGASGHPRGWEMRFEARCVADCAQTGAEPVLCRSTCACTRRDAEAAGLPRASSDPAAERRTLAAIATACFGRAAP